MLELPVGQEDPRNMSAPIPRIALVIPVRDVNVVIPHPYGLDEIVLQSCGPPGRARNVGVRKTSGDILVFSEDDLVLAGNLNWLRWRPREEVWWPCAGYTDCTGDPYTVKAMGFLNTMLALHNIAGVGPVVAVRRFAFTAVGGYEDRDLLGDFSFARKLYTGFGVWKTEMPVQVGVHRPNRPPGELMVQQERWFTADLPEDGPFVRLVPTTER
jgi:hypothetical protein